MFNAINPDSAGKDPFLSLPLALAFVEVDQPETAIPFQVIALFKRVPNIATRQLTTRLVGELLNSAREIRLHALGQFQALVLLDNPCHTALTALRVHANNRLVAASKISWIDWQIGHPPDFIILTFLCCEAFLYGVLMRP